MARISWLLVPSLEKLKTHHFDPVPVHVLIPIRSDHKTGFPPVVTTMKVL